MRSLVAALLFGVLTVQAQDSILPASLPATWSLQRPDATYATSQVFSVTGQPFATAIRVATLKRPANNYNIQLNIATSAAVASNDVLFATFYLRRVAPVDSDAFAAFIFERAGSPYEKSAARTFNEGAGQWQVFRYAFVAATNYAAGQAQVNFPVGYDPQTIEIGGVTVTNYHQTVALTNLPSDITYAGRATNATWRAPAASRIDQVRKADLTLLVQDDRGVPLPGVNLSVRMKRHAFGFGSAIDGATLLGTGLTNDIYRGVITQWFNKAVMENDLKWPNFESNPSRATNSVNWLRSRDIAVRGHNLIWPAWRWMPSSAASLSNNPAALRTRITNHITSTAVTFAGKLADWDVVNEPYTEHDVMDVLGNAEMIEWFKLAKTNDPSARLFVNDYGNLEEVGTNTAHQVGFYNIINYLVTNGAPVEGIGLQGHFGSFLSPPDQILALLDRYGSFGLPLQVTEFDINVLDTAVQADYTRDFLTLAFSHPSLNTVLMWGFWEGRHWLPDAALFRRDWSIKPNGVTWTNLVFGEWWTQTNRVSDASGRLTLRGFKGDYELEAAVAGLTNIMSAQLLTNRMIVLTLTNPPVDLRVERGASTLKLSWPGHGAGMHLERNDSLTPGSWIANGQSPELTNGLWQVETVLPTTNRFFRLSR